MNKAFGLTMGGGVLIPDDLLQAVKGFGWTHIRQGNRDDTAINTTLAKQISDAGLTPVLGILRASQLPDLTVGEVIVEVSSTGVENTPNYDVEAAALNAAPVVAAIKAKGLKAYAGMKGTSQSDIAWTAAFCKLLDPLYGICVHRYPPKGATTWDAPQWNSRAFELQQLKQAIGPRPFIVGEWGWNQEPFKRHWWEYLLFSHSHLTDDEQTAAIKQEFAYWQQGGADVAVLYQFTDGPVYCTTHPQYAYAKDDGYGIRRVTSTGAHLSWKPSASVPKGS